MSEPYWVALGPKATPVDYVGDWAAGTPYLPGQVVRRNGADHIAVNPSTGQEPPGQVGVLPVIGLGLAFPASPYDGQEYVLVDSLTAPTFTWRFRYMAASSGNKWKFVGGAPARSEVLTGEGTTSGTPVDLTTVGPQITVPVAGDYDWEINAQTSQSGTFVDIMGVKIGAAAFNDDDSFVAQHQVTGQSLTGSKKRRALAVPAGAVLKAQYRVTGGTGTFMRRNLFVTPVAVSA